MTYRLGWMAWATGAMVLAAASGCGGSSADPPPTTPVTTPASSVPPTSATPTDPSMAAVADATKLMRRYLAVLDTVRSSRHGNVAKLKSVATSSELAGLENLVRRQQDEGQRQIGATVLSKLAVQSVNLANSDPAEGKVPVVVIDVCWNVSSVDLVDQNGKSVVPPSRPDTGWTRYTVANYRYARNPHNGWRVATGQDLKQAPCATA